jgi:hypothetical protein
LNPLRAQIVKSIEELDGYRWSGHHDIISKVENSWMDTEYVLFQFGSTRRKALHAYRSFMREGTGQDQMEELTGGGLIRSQGGWSQVLAMRRRGQKQEFDERILGSGDFVTKVLKEADERHLRQIRNKRSGRTIQMIIDEECRNRGISLRELIGGNKRRKVSDARALIALRSREELGLSSAEIARHVGVNTSSIARAIERIERQSA